MDTLLEKVENYWTGRSDGYCQSNTAELDSQFHDAWKDLIHEYAPGTPGRSLRVLDVGTGPGFLALIMAGCGHAVTAVDYTESMLQKARFNAAERGLSIAFQRMDAQELDFEADTFDLVLTRNLTWNLEQPEKAYREFFRVLGAGGRLLNFDANWFLHLFDPVLGQAYERDRRNAQKHRYPDHTTLAAAKAMKDIALALPLSRTRRPAWDIGVLEETGFKRVTIEFGIGSRVWNEVQKVNHASTPMFMIAADK